MRSLTALLVVLGVAALAAAGELVYHNGSRLAGDLAAGTLLVSTGTDLIEVDAAQVAVLTADEVRLKDGRAIRGALVGQRLRVRTALGELAIDPGELREFRADAPAPVAPRPAPAAPPAPESDPVAAAAVAEPPGGPAVARATEPRYGPDQMVEGAKTVGRGVEATAKGVGRTVSQGADRLHDGFKAFGLAIWEGMKNAGRVVRDTFTAD